MQAVCISNRPGDIRETLTYWEILVPWIDEVLLVCPGDLRDKMPSGARIRVRTVDEAQLLGSKADLFRQSADHQLKNLLLRAGIARSPDVDDIFLMFDDDHRPLTKVYIDDFIEYDRHHNYFFYQLDHWRAQASDFDKGQHNSALALNSRGLETRAYASHMPQVIDKNILKEAFSEFDDEISAGTALDEWSLYFNYALDTYPERFHHPRPFATLCWPALPTDWELDVRPTRFLFENYYKALYEPGRIFFDLPTCCIEAEVENHAATKIARRTKIQDAYESGPARIHRRLCWMLYRLVAGTDSATQGFGRTRRFFARATPKSMQRTLSEIAEHGEDPAFWRSYG